MFARFSRIRSSAARLFALMSMLWIAACDPIAMVGSGGSDPTIDTSAPVQVALLVPTGSGAAQDAFLAQNLENAARLAIADLGDVQIDLRVYGTAGNPQQAANAAVTAVNDGAKIILGPLYAEAANAAGVAVAGNDINVLAFSNNTSIAGGNVYVLGPTFANTANRLVRYLVAQGTDRIMIVHGDDVPGNVGRDAIASAVRRNGGTVAGIESYPLSQQGIFGRVGAIASATRASGADAVFMTAGVSADLPILATALPDQGISPTSVQYLGLTRWNAAPQALSLPGLQGGLFALPDQQMQARFEGRYAAAYGEQPHPLSGLAYDGIAAIGALVKSGNSQALTSGALTQASGFQGVNGIFRLLPNGTNERGLSVAQIRDNQVIIVNPAPRSFGTSAGL
jgi:ABC-type branched-subunit amino acid transport system substrate-binding protein